MSNEGAESPHLIERAAWHFANQVAQCTHQAAPDQPKPNQRQHLARCVTGNHQHAEQSVDHARAATGEAAGTKPGAANLPVSELRTRGGDNPVAIEVCPPAELDAISKDPGLKEGVNTYAGHCTYEAVASAQGIPYSPLEKLINRN